ncbi:hypothetical protein SAMN05216223_106119 [Actinacidiphila yanglinensis]|uniref:IrrE N-terminal-like domain-containing protein n=1 Tax=Actinacidiphila yanglinensis TaxID=310779 RepID=A0A1H6B1A1_9ACTN|nr:hypothetical protein SAMN05216223_106119 [Actinacidiphila yanglinensis]
MNRDGTEGAESSGRLWERCRSTVATLDLPDPFDVVTFIGMLARGRGRPIELIPLTARPNTPCGLLVTTDRADYIAYSTDTTPLHQQHILLHEVAHLICGHHQTAPAVSDAARVLLLHLPPSLIRRVLGRTVYTEPQEQEAELVASLILYRTAAGTTAPPPPPGAPRSPVESVFGAPGGRGPRHD